MKLAIITDEGTVAIVTDCLEDYNLDKPVAVASLIEDLRTEIASVEQRAVSETKDVS